MSGAQFIEFWKYILRLAIMLVVGVCEKIESPAAELGDLRLIGGDFCWCGVSR